MTSYLVTGGCRGIGLELTKQLAALASTAIVFTTTRSTSPSPDLATLISSAGPGKVVHVSADAKSADSVRKAAETVASHLGGAGLDVLVNNVGETGGYCPDGLVGMAAETLSGVFETNVVSAHIATAAFLDLMRKGKAKKVVNISTTMGSMAMAPGFGAAGKRGLPSYFITKAALNMLTVQWALDLEKDGFSVAAVTPGCLKTDLGSQYADLDVATGVKGVVEIINKLNPEKNGKFLNVHVPGWEDKVSTSRYDGQEILW